jgi:hypothetical protein
VVIEGAGGGIDTVIATSEQYHAVRGRSAPRLRPGRQGGRVRKRAGSISRARSASPISFRWNHSVGDFCTHEGSLWHCNVSTIGTRPSDTRDWQLAVKRGRDAQPRGTALPRS